MASNGSTMYESFTSELNCTDSSQCNNCTGENCSSPVFSPIPGFEELDPTIISFQSNSRFWIQRVLVPIIMIIGVIGNTVTIFIMTQRRMRSSTNWYLAALAIFDMSYLVLSFLLSLKHYPHIEEPQFYPYWILVPYLWTLTDASSNSSVWITVTFTIERYIAVCHPIKGKVICTESRAKKMIIAVFIFCTAITVPTVFEWKITERVDPLTNATSIKLDYTELGQDPVYVTIYSWLVSVLFVFVPLVLLAVFNAFLIKSVHSSKSRRKTMTRRRETGDQSRQESKITVMLIAVVILFLVCQLPTAVTILYKAFHVVRQGSNEDFLLLGLGNIFNFLVAVNAAGNFVLYCLLSQKYRRTFLLIFCPCLKDKIPRLKSVYHNNTTYSTMDSESPAASRKYCVRAVEGQAPVVKQQQPQLSFSKKVSVFTTNDYEEGDVGSGRRLLRCPWKRPKIATEGPPHDDKTTRQFIPLKSPSKCNNVDIASD